MRNILALTLALAATPAFAGYKTNAPVHVTIHADGSASFTGSVGDARASADGNQFIGCSLTGSTIISGYCYAMDAAGNAYYCLLDSVSQQQAVAAIGPQSSISVQGDAHNNCTGITIDNFSYYRPATP